MIQNAMFKVPWRNFLNWVKMRLVSNSLLGVQLVFKPLWDDLPYPVVSQQEVAPNDLSQGELRVWSVCQLGYNNLPFHASRVSVFVICGLQYFLKATGDFEGTIFDSKNEAISPANFRPQSFWRVSFKVQKAADFQYCRTISGLRSSTLSVFRQFSQCFWRSNHLKLSRCHRLLSSVSVDSVSGILGIFHLGKGVEHQAGHFWSALPAECLVHSHWSKLETQHFASKNMIFILQGFIDAILNSSSAVPAWAFSVGFKAFFGSYKWCEKRHWFTVTCVPQSWP